MGQYPNLLSVLKKAVQIQVLLKSAQSTGPFQLLSSSSGELLGLMDNLIMGCIGPDSNL